MAASIVLSHVYSWPEHRRGGERYLHELGAALARVGHRVEILTTGSGRRRSDHVLGVSVTRLTRRELLPRRFGELSNEMAFGLQVLGRARDRSVDVWHALGTADAAAATSTSRWWGGRSVHTALGFPSSRSRERRPDRRLHRYLVDHVDRYVCLSEQTGSFLRSDYGREPIVLGGGVDLARFAPAEHRSEHPAILFTSALDEPRKNLKALIAGFERVLETEPRCELWLAGPGDRRSALDGVSARVRARIVDLGVGSPEDVAAWYGRAWATALPAEAEAFGLVVLESLACGTPVVTLDQGAPAELVEPGTGARARGVEAEHLAEACVATLELARRRDTTERCRAAAAPHDWDRMVPRFEEVYFGDG